MVFTRWVTDIALLPCPTITNTRSVLGQRCKKAEEGVFVLPLPWLFLYRFAEAILRINSRGRDIHGADRSTSTDFIST